MFGLVRVFAVLAVVAVGACGGGSIAVDRMATLSSEPGDPHLANFVVVRAKAQVGAPDYARYAEQIAARLTAKGFMQVDTAQRARYALMFSYDDDGMAKSSRDDRRDRAGAEGKIARTLTVSLYDLTRPNRPDEKVFVGSAQCTVDSAMNDPALYSALIEAVMKDFPGKGQETYSVSLPKLN